MPWGWECREKLVKQRSLKFTVRRGPISLETKTPGPGHYTTPEIIGGRGYSKINRLPAYTFGKVLKPIGKPPARPNAPMFDVSKTGPKGAYKILGSVVSPQLKILSPRTKPPGPGAYEPGDDSRYKSSPAFSMRLAARPPYQPWDQWTPPPNMYLPPKTEKRAPAYSFGPQFKHLKPFDVPGPGSHEPNFLFVEKTKPAFSFGAPFKPLKPPKVPAPNRYCERKFRSIMPTIPAPSFGIRHTQYLGVQPVYLKSSKLEIQAS